MKRRIFLYRVHYPGPRPSFEDKEFAATATSDDAAKAVIEHGLYASGLPVEVRLECLSKQYELTEDETEQLRRSRSNWDMLLDPSLRDLTLKAMEPK